MKSVLSFRRSGKK